jgi:uncharacterized protein involved in exopolysaccharide biosynthesis
MSRDYLLEEEEGGSGGSFIAHIPAMIKQRKWLVIVPAVLFLIAGIVAALLLPTVYRSSAVLLVESPVLPQEIAGAPTDDIVDQRIAKVRQQVVSRPQLIELIQKHGLYVDERARKPLSEIVETMREATTIEPVSSQVQQSAAGKSTTIAFTLSFGYEDAVKAQAVAQDMTEQVLLIDATRNTEQAQNTVQFLTDQAADLQRTITQLEDQIATIKAQNGAVLSNTGPIMSGSTGSYDVQIAALQRDNAQLIAQRDVTKSSAQRDPVVANAEAQLAAARAVYAESHPDVVLARQRLAEARELAARNVEKQPVDQITSQIEFNNSQIAKLQAARSQEAARLSASLGAQSRAPLVMEQISQLQQRLDVLNSQYQGVSQRLLGAQASAKAETEQKGERLTVVDPPVVPEEPDSLNKLLVIGAGLAAGLALGIVLVLAAEFIFRPIRDTHAVAAIVGELPLVVVPVIRDGPPQKRVALAEWWARRKGQRGLRNAGA